MLKPGRELDALIARRVMGLETGHDGNEPIVIERGTPTSTLVAHCSCPHYSSDVADAWALVSHLQPTWTIILQWDDDEQTWTVELDDFERPPIGAIADTFPYALCLAALDAYPERKAS